MLDEAIKLKFEAYLRGRDKANLEQLVTMLTLLSPRSNVIHESVFKDEVAKALASQALGLKEEELAALRVVWNEQLGDTMPLSVSNPNPTAPLLQKEASTPEKIPHEARAIFQKYLDSMKSLNNASGMLGVSNMLGLEPLSIEETNQRMFDEAVGWAFRSHLKAYSALKKIDANMLELREMWNAKFPNFPVIEPPQAPLESISISPQQQAIVSISKTTEKPRVPAGAQAVTDNAIASLEQNQIAQTFRRKTLSVTIAAVVSSVTLGAIAGTFAGPIGVAIGAVVGLIFGLGAGLAYDAYLDFEYKASQKIQYSLETLHSSETSISPKPTVEEKKVAKGSFTPHYDTSAPQTEETATADSVSTKDKQSLIKPN